MQPRARQRAKINRAGNVSDDGSDPAAEESAECQLGTLATRCRSKLKCWLTGIGAIAQVVGLGHALRAALHVSIAGVAAWIVCQVFQLRA